MKQLNSKSRLRRRTAHNFIADGTFHQARAYSHNPCKLRPFHIAAYMKDGPHKNRMNHVWPRPYCHRGCCQATAFGSQLCDSELVVVFGGLVSLRNPTQEGTRSHTSLVIDGANPVMLVIRQGWHEQPSVPIANVPSRDTTRPAYLEAATLGYRSTVLWIANNVNRIVGTILANIRSEWWQQYVGPCVPQGVAVRTMKQRNLEPSCS